MSDYTDDWENSHEGRLIRQSLAKYGEATACPYCGWSLKELGHSLDECERAAATMREDCD